MSDPAGNSAGGPVDVLYRRRNYPPMSHPVSDPAVSSIAAWIGGLKTPPPAGAAILEIGCGLGHNLIPLGRRWPAAELTGMDISEEMIAVASRRAAESGTGNVTFIAADLRSFDFGGRTFDYIIAHGFFSWVADDVKMALLDFCAKHLAPAGIATVSFNVSAGWEERKPVVAAARRIMGDHGIDEMAALTVMRAATEDPHLVWMIDDMLAKGPEILLFDDFAPVNDAWPLDRFVIACARAGLRWLGESDPAENLPSSLDDAARASLVALAADPLKMQMAADEMAGSAFRSGVLCREDAPVRPRISTGVVMDMAIRAGQDIPQAPGPLLGDLLKALEPLQPACVPVPELLQRMAEADPPAVARLVFEAITRGVLRARAEPVRFDPSPGARPCLDAFRLLCAREKIPLVDVWHLPCLFPDAHYELLAAMDGSRSLEALAALSKRICPDLDFEPWLAHLAARGMFA